MSRFKLTFSMIICILLAAAVGVAFAQARMKIGERSAGGNDEGIAVLSALDRFWPASTDGGDVTASSVSYGVAAGDTGASGQGMKVQASDSEATTGDPVVRHAAVEAKPEGVDVQKLCSDATNAFIHASFFAAANGMKSYKFISRMPKNTRQVREGYWIGSLPGADNVDALYAHRVRLVITATHNEENIAPFKERLEALNMTQLVLPFGSKFPKGESFMPTVSQFAPDGIFIHCDHGGDRSGALLAYLLVKRHGWKLQHALLAVLYPGHSDIKGLKAVLDQRGYPVADSDVEQYLGIYSATSNGGFGGLKVRSHNYRKLVNTLIDSIEK